MRVAAELSAVMATQTALDAGASQDEIHEIGVETRSRPRFRTVLTRRVRYWTDGAVIGSKTFLREVEARIRDASKPPKRFDASDDGLIFSYRQLRS